MPVMQVAALPLTGDRCVTLLRCFTKPLMPPGRGANGFRAAAFGRGRDDLEVARTAVSARPRPGIAAATISK